MTIVKVGDIHEAAGPPADGPPAEPSPHGERAPAGPGEPLRYTTFDDRPGSTHNLVVGLVPPGSHVLEIGSATGYMSEVLRERLGCTVVAVELDPAAAAQAEGRADRVLVGDAEALQWGALFPEERFDAVVFADVLEHLRDPAAVLDAVRPLLSERGAVVASVPNVAHVSVRLALLAGEFRYRETGLLDATHLRFFTRTSLQELLESCGLAATRWLRTRQTLDQSEVEVPARMRDATAVALASADPEATTYQFVVHAVPTGSAAEVAELRRAGDEAARAHERALHELREAAAARDEALESALDELREVRLQLISAQNDVRERDDAIDTLGAELEVLAAARDELLAQLEHAVALADRGVAEAVGRAVREQARPLLAAYRAARVRAGR